MAADASRATSRASTPAIFAVGGRSAKSKPCTISSCELSQSRNTHLEKLAASLSRLPTGDPAPSPTRVQAIPGPAAWANVPVAVSTCSDPSDSEDEEGWLDSLAELDTLLGSAGTVPI